LINGVHALVGHMQKLAQPMPFSNTKADADTGLKEYILFSKMDKDFHTDALLALILSGNSYATMITCLL
jgi:hypothetical protein